MLVASRLARNSLVQLCAELGEHHDAQSTQKLLWQKGPIDLVGSFFIVVFCWPVRCHVVAKTPRVSHLDGANSSQVRHQHEGTVLTQMPTNNSIRAFKAEARSTTDAAATGSGIGVPLIVSASYPVAKSRSLCQTPHNKQQGE